MCPLENLVLLDVFMEIISDSSDQYTAYSTISELDKKLNDQLQKWRSIQLVVAVLDVY